MKRRTLFGVLTTSLLAMLLGSAPASADFLHRGVGCPTDVIDEEGVFTLIDLEGTDGQIRISDVILSGNSEGINFSLQFEEEDGDNTLMAVFLPENGTVVSNFQGDVLGEPGANLVARCSVPDDALTSVSVTIVGTVESGDSPTPADEEQ